MTLLALEIDMPAGQREVRLIVIEGCILPAARIVAAGAIRAKPPAVFIVALMTGKTIRRRLLKIRQHTRIEVAFHTGDFGMTAIQRKLGRRA